MLDHHDTIESLFSVDLKLSQINNNQFISVTPNVQIMEILV